MCRVLGCVATEPVTIRRELLEADNPFIRQSEEHDSGWGMAVYERPDRREPRCVRFRQAAHAEENTHPFCFLFSDGERLYAYRLGMFGLHWLQEPHVERLVGDAMRERAEIAEQARAGRRLRRRARGRYAAARAERMASPT